ncbi:neutral ceramidase isoform X1 [Hypanus sabinus]|uniref:neutral ceramidase isoform X1 n=2 Tax=Hypanus sabinus TaxID=79690 RepID=UPI0028C4961C|nr:neutral ceramidase isoform X1 [Hypanus sabinus]XP_059803422.1 neutral ceramidase isoform X1 [Hypanus sabinus]XP_059803423.1 neutral ceramidase isoform X1 [Hypanus sabinus]
MGSKNATSFQISFAVLFVLMTAVTVAVIAVFFVSVRSEADLKSTEEPSTHYQIGAGRADCTGPIANLPMMGYANPDQTAAGLHTRLFSRAFIVADPSTSKRVVFVSSDIGMISQKLRLEVLKRLKTKYGNLYRQDNVVLSGTHTHSGPAGYFQYTLCLITSKGYIKPSINALINGIIKSIDIAHKNMKPGKIFVNKGTVEGSNINRSPYSYLQNPKEERARYKSNTDTELVLLKMEDLDGQAIGILSWFAVHPVSMNNSNHLVSSDNMGHASYLFEQDKNVGCLPGEGPFVAAFASTNLGDVSANTLGPHCINTGETCDNSNSTCPIGGSSMCMSSGPGKDMFESTAIIGRSIYNKAKELFRTATREIKGPINFAHQWVNMTDVTVQFNSTHKGHTCKPALGYSFAAGTTDGVGAFNFTQGTVEGDPFWDSIRDMLLGKPSNETQKCHHPKPILFNTGYMSKPLPWHPDIVDVQILTIGTLAIVAVPGEFTTMSGRRLRENVKRELESTGTLKDVDVVVAGLCNVYTHYITTYEEYQVQRYEGASTIYGPHTLSAYIQLFKGLAKAIAENSVDKLPQGPEPPNYPDKLLVSLLLPNPVDKKPTNTSFGDVLIDVQALYKPGDIAEVTFISGNPRNSVALLAGGTFLTVERYDNVTGDWTVMYNDASWDTRLYWNKGLKGHSNVTVAWHIPYSVELGMYRINHYGHFKTLKLIKPVFHPYSGSSSPFQVKK